MVPAPPAPPLSVEFGRAAVQAHLDDPPGALASPCGGSWMVTVKGFDVHILPASHASIIWMACQWSGGDHHASMSFVPRQKLIVDRSGTFLPSAVSVPNVSSRILFFAAALGTAHRHRNKAATCTSSCFMKLANSDPRLPTPMKPTFTFSFGLIAERPGAPAGPSCQPPWCFS